MSTILERKKQGSILEQKLKIQYHCALYFAKLLVFCVPLWYVRKKRTFYPFVDYRWELVSHQIPQTLQKCPLLSKHRRLRKPRAKRKKIEQWYFVTKISLTRFFFGDQEKPVGSIKSLNSNFTLAVRSRKGQGQDSLFVSSQ